MESLLWFNICDFFDIYIFGFVLFFFGFMLCDYRGCRDWYYLGKVIRFCMKG